MTNCSTTGKPASPNKSQPLYKQYKEKRKAIWHDPELDGYDKLRAQAYLKSSYGKMVVEHGYDSVYDPVKFATFLDKEASCEKADIIERCNDKAGGIDEVEWTYIGPDGRINGIISGPKGRFSIKSIFAGGYSIQCLPCEGPSPQTQVITFVISRNM